MSLTPKIRLRTRLLAACLMAVAIAVPLSATTTTVSAATAQGPCDIYAAGGTPCETAHSTTRALFAAYNGPLYQVQRASDHAYSDISLLSAGGACSLVFTPRLNEWQGYRRVDLEVVDFQPGAVDRLG